MKRGNFFAMSVLAASVLATTSALAGKPKNIIMVVGDGMGPAYTTAYRYFADDAQTVEVENTVFDRHLVGMASTYPARVSGYVTDSAASATALSSGVKSYNGAIAVDENKQPVLTVLQQARKNGQKTGVAVTSQINHATPASYAAHNEYRRNYNAIADSYFDDKVDGKFVLDVMLGGGWEYFLRDDRNLVEEFQRAGYHYLDDLNKLDDIPANTPVLGLFGETGMPWALDTRNHLRLPQMTQAAVRQLENDKGFFLLVEASQVDWAGHANDIGAAMAEMHDMAVTLEWLETYVADNPDTLVVVTADHSTGGLTIAAQKEYRWDPEWLKKLGASPTSMSKSLVTDKDRVSSAESLLGFPLDEAEAAALKAVPEDDRAMYDWVTSVLDTRTNTGWTTSGHTAVDVQVFAMGKWRDQFSGYMDNTDIPKRLFALMEAKED